MKKIFVLFVILILSAVNTSVLADVVVYNVKTGKIHSPGCQWAQKCTVNCVRMERAKALKSGGVPCKVCGGK